MTPHTHIQHTQPGPVSTVVNSGARYPCVYTRDMPKKAAPSKRRENKTARFQMLMTPSVKAELQRAADEAQPTRESLNEYIIKAALLRARSK